MVKEIALTKGYTAIVDDDDYELVSQYHWSANVDNRVNPPNVRALTFVPNKKGVKPRQRGLFMHCLIMPAPNGLEVDHVNGNSLDNRRSNLRLATHAENLRNRRVFTNNRSGYKGVAWDGKTKKWKANLRIGSFETPEEAARAYDQVARLVFGEFAKTNF